MKPFSVLVLPVLMGLSLLMTGNWKGKDSSVATTRAVPLSTINKGIFFDP
jgi:hypothetical protein